MSYVDQLLSDEDLVRITGTEKPSEQKKVLQKNGIRFFTGKNNTVTTTWFHVNHPELKRAANNDGEPDFSSLVG